MKFLEKLSSRAAKSASTAVKEEMQGAAFDLLPTLLGLGGMIFGTYMLHHREEKANSKPMLPGYSQITITTNNYYFGGEFANRFMDKEED